MTVPDADAARRPRAASAIEFIVVLGIVWVPMVVDALLRRVPRQLSVADEIYFFTLSVVGVGLLFYVVRRNDVGFASLGLRRVRWWWELGHAALIYVAAWAVAIGYETLLIDWQTPVEEPWQIPVAVPVYLLALAVLEESMRAYVFSRVEQLTQSGVVALVASLVVFVLPHPYGVRGLVWIACFGLLYGVLYWRMRSMPRLALSHWAFNLALEYGWWPVSWFHE